ncbi:MAG: response regulator [Euryarchaeota archaeon]|nr:response regulator [Euryarchaeota archaeon]MCG2736068.1 response regulator [Candidatus Methanoperedenaceae archaeon]
MNLNEIEILLVEDKATDAELVLRSLKKITKKFYVVGDGAEALEFIFATGKYAQRNMENVPSVILLDLKLPKVNGIEVLRRIKSDDRTKNIPVVALTSSSEDRDLRECYKLGINSYIVKPVDFEKFMQAVTDLCKYWLSINMPPP